MTRCASVCIDVHMSEVRLVGLDFCTYIMSCSLALSLVFSSLGLWLRFDYLDGGMKVRSNLNLA